MFGDLLMSFAFEVKERDLLGRIGKIKTRSGNFETPTLLPVINPRIQVITPNAMKNKLGCKAIITNAYLIKKQFGEEAVKKGVKKILDFDGVVMTDSGAYQILEYGEVGVTPEEIVHYQEAIESDIATILDVPTGWRVPKDYAKLTVKETYKRAKQLFKIRSRTDIAWVGPVQGGQHLDLVAYSAKAMGELPFQIHALGSPTKVMEQYLFDVLQDMIVTAKINLPLERPLHLFGAGHPFMFSFAVALGCDLFDSASYAIYARENRYMTEYGTSKLEELEYFPCSCPICSENTPKNVFEMSAKERQQLLAQHNLYVCFAEIKRVKQAIVEGRLWELLELRAHSHPSLLQTLKKLRKYENFIEKYSPVTKPSGIFFFSFSDLTRPEVVRYRTRLTERYSPPEDAKFLVLLPQTRTKPFHNSNEYKNFLKKLREKLDEESLSRIHICIYDAPFGLIPIELDETFPLSQHEIIDEPDLETISYAVEQTANYVKRTNYNEVFIFKSADRLGEETAKACRKTCREKNVPFHIFSVKDKLSDEKVNVLIKCLMV